MVYGMEDGLGHWLLKDEKKACYVMDPKSDALGVKMALLTFQT